MVGNPQPYQSFEQYLDLERRAEFKSEFHAGKLYAMAGGTEPHSRLSVQVLAALLQQFSSCRVYDSNLKLYIRQADRCCYPDAMLLCGEPEFYDNQHDVIVNPYLVAEVLSPSTRRYDQETKTDYYRSVPSIEHILLISQDQVFIEHFARQKNKTWIITAYSDRRGTIALSNVALSVEAIYRGIL